MQPLYDAMIQITKNVAYKDIATHINFYFDHSCLARAYCQVTKRNKQNEINNIQQWAINILQNFNSVIQSVFLLLPEWWVV